MIGDQTKSYSHNTKANYLYPDPVNLQINSISQNISNKLSNSKKITPLKIITGQIVKVL